MRVWPVVIVVWIAGCGAPSPPADTPADPPASSVPRATEPPVPTPVASEPPEMPYEDAGACPFEGCVYREWVARERVQVLAERRDGARESFAIGAGEPVMAVTGVVSVTRPGRVQVTEPTAIETNAGSLTLQPTETLYLLTPLGEGHFVASVRGRIVRDVDPLTARVLEPVQFTWWVQLRNAAGQTGWAKVRPGQFRGMDLLSGPE
jgi:hypothetical protein